MTAEETPGGELAGKSGFSLDQQSAEQIKSQTASARADLTRRQMEAKRAISDARERFDRESAAMQARFDEQRRALEAQMAPLRAELKRMEEMSWTVDLYLGRHEDVTLIKDGKPAPAETPLTIRQMVLAADEESLILAEDNSFDHRDMDSFVEWLIASDENRDRVVPDERCVVVVVPTRQARRYGNPFEDAQRGSNNARAHWIIRNGERLYLMVTDPELAVGENLIPRRDEFVKFFYTKGLGGLQPEPLHPGSAEWVYAEGQADQVKKHYMRLMLVLQGLIDRSVAFHPLPKMGVNLMSVTSQDDGTVRLINERDLVLTDGRVSFRSWQSALNSQLRVGVRVVLGRGISECSYDGGYRNRRISPANASLPPIGVPLMIEGKRDGGFVVRYERMDEVERREWVETRPGWGYHGHTYSSATKRASAVLVPSEDSWVLPFDLASVDDLNYYLNSRRGRGSYADMVQMIKSALRSKAAEYEAEATLRKLLLDTIASEDGSPHADGVEAELDGLVQWWKAGNKYARALAGDSETEAKAAPAIMKEWAKRQTSKPKPSAAERVLAASKSVDNLLAVAYTRSKKFIALSASDVELGPWLTETTFSAEGTVVETKEWGTVAPRTLSTMTVLWADPQWQTWDKFPDLNGMLSGPEHESVMQEVRDRLAAMGSDAFLVTEHCDDARFLAYGWRKDVDPTDHEAYSGKENGRSGHEGLMDALVEVVGVTWERRGGVVALASHRRGLGVWGKYSAANGESVPFWSKDDLRHGSTTSRHVLVWRTDELDRALTLADAHAEMNNHEREIDWRARQKIGRAALAAMSALESAWITRATGKARTDFEEDFGAQAIEDEELWLHHLGTLNLKGRVPKGWRYWADPIFRWAVESGVVLEGKTLGAVIETYREATTGSSRNAASKADLEPWLDLVIPASPKKDESSDGSHTKGA